MQVPTLWWPIYLELDIPALYLTVLKKSLHSKSKDLNVTALFAFDKLALR